MNIFRTFALGITMVGLMMPHATQAEENTATARFFYSETCPTCHVMRAYMDQVCALNPDVPIEMLDTSVNPEAWQSACEGAGIPVWGVRGCLFRIVFLRIGAMKKASWFIFHPIMVTWDIGIR